jgi:NTP pyrophosphatase (non-canonical NTP hydrolase)
LEFPEITSLTLLSYIKVVNPKVLFGKANCKITESSLSFLDIIHTMDIRELTDEMHRFVRAKGWYEPDSPRPQTMRNLAISLSLEVGEVLEHFQWKEAPIDQEELASELADVTLYLIQLASLSGIDLEEAVLNKLKTNYSRTWDQ